MDGTEKMHKKAGMGASLTVIPESASGLFHWTWRGKQNEYLSRQE
jgi:hypothetical protein